MRKDNEKSLYWRIIFILLAFAVMVILSYLFNSKAVRINLKRNADSVLSFTHQQIEAELIASKMMLGGFSQTVRQILLDGDTDKLQYYINIISDYIISGEAGLKNINGLYGYFETPELGNVLLYSDYIDWVMPEDFAVTDFIWYKAAAVNCNAVVETQPYIDYMTGEYIITYSRCINDYGGNRIGIVCIDVPLDKIGEIVTKAALIDSGYGVLAAADFTIFAHENKNYIGSRMDDLDSPLAQFADEFYQGKEIYERPIKNWKGEDVIVFSRTLPNGWYLMLMSPTNLYYSGTTQMLIVLCVLGSLMALSLVVVFIRIDKAKVKADEESKQKSAFLANMSHEIRTPMNAIIGMTYIGKTADDVTRKNYCLEKIENASKHLLGVINDILDMSKIEADKFELSHDDFNFEKMLQGVISIVGFRADGKKQKISVFADKSIPPVLIGDDQRLSQVIANLLGNAVKFTSEGGLIKLDAVLESEEDGLCTIRVTVTDSGIGISQEHQKLLFKAFQQADVRIARKFGGTGLGLAISKNIIELMDGKIELTSEVGKGSSFSFTFKALRSLKNEMDLLDKKEETDNSKLFEGYKILLAEDAEINQEIINALTEPTLLKIDCVVNGLEAVSMFEKSPDEYDLILMDVQMPEMDGLEASRKIRKFEEKLLDSPAAGSAEGETRKNKRKPVPIIAMTANVFREDVEMCLQAGMNDHLGKPLDTALFFNMLRKYLPEKQKK